MTSNLVSFSQCCSGIWVFKDIRLTKTYRKAFEYMFCGSLKFCTDFLSRDKDFKTNLDPFSHVLKYVKNIHIFTCRYIKMSSPNLNNIILLGALLAFMSIIFSGANSVHISEGTHLLACKVSFTSVTQWTYVYGSIPWVDNLGFGSQ